MDAYIGRPKGFHYMEGSESINFRKTFDLKGTENDEMLRLYLRKAGLSDEIELLTVGQRRAFIYDIIKSNKMPGYWMPSTMQSSPTKPSTPTLSMISSGSEERRNNTNSGRPNQRETMRSSVSCGSLQNLNISILPERYIPPGTTPPTPTTSIVTSRRGIKYEISGPMNFQHTAGDMNRDMTRNAFDLSSSNNDNVLRKYMIERGISKEDVAGMRKTDLIRKIVQSKFTWMPSKKKNLNNSDAPTTGDFRLNYATISGYPEHRRTRTALTMQPSPSSPRLRTDFSNYVLVPSRFGDPKSSPPRSEENNEDPKSEPNVGVIELPPLPPGTQLPDPPPRKSQFSSASLPTIKKNVPPPRLVIASGANGSHHSRAVEDYDNNFSFDPMHSMKPIKTSNQYEPIYAATTTNPLSKRTRTPPPTPPKPFAVKSFPQINPKVGAGNIPLPPPPPPPLIQRFPDNCEPPSTSEVPTHPAPPGAQFHSVHSAQQPLQQIEPKQAVEMSKDDPRDAMLESIRKGVTLKKVEGKAATISGIKPRTERRPQVMDFLTELKMGVTLRRTKNPDDNPFASS